jgi:hypothetical protein
MRGLTVLGVFILLAGCGGEGRDRIAERVEENADNRAAAMEAASRSMTDALQQNIAEQQAEAVRQAGEERADAIRNSQLEAEALTPEQRNELIAGE